ncbi:hypothetical protein D3C84_735030 [compost metagenome]
MVDIQHLLLLGDFEDDLVEGQVEALRGFQGGTDTGLRLVHGIGHEVDRNHARYLQARSQFYRLDPAALVKGIEVFLRDPGQQAAG